MEGTMEKRMHVQPFVREAGWELPASLDALLPARHPVRFVAQYVDGLTDDDWQQLGVRWQEGGQGAHGYHPRVLLAAWLWGFMSGVRSSRRLEAACTDHLSCLWLTGGQHPDHNTLWRFYQAHRAGMRSLLTDTVRMAVRLGLVDLAIQAVDGTKVSGNAAKERSYDQKGLDRLLERTARAIADLEAQNSTDDAPPPPRLPQELATARALRERIQEERERLAPDRRVNLTDRDARLMPTRRGYVAGYNAQAVVSPLAEAVAGRSGMLVTAADVTDAPDDHAQLLPMLDAAAETTGVRAAVSLVDGGYCSAPVLVGCAERKQEVLMPVGDGDGGRALGPYHKDHFTYDAATDRYRCPEGQVLVFAGIRRRQGRRPLRAYRAGAAVCRSCPAFGHCTTDRRKGRVIEIAEENPVLVAQRVLMATEKAKARYARRKELIEPVFGLLKEQQGLRRFLLRGKAQVQAEWGLLAAAFNLRTLARIWQGNPVLCAR
jgi:transposase